MKDKELKKILNQADDVGGVDVEVPDMSRKIKSLVGEIPSETTAPAGRKAGRGLPSRKRITAITMAGVLAFCSIAGVLTWFFAFRLSYDFEKGLAASSRAENAQYLPNIDKLISSSEPEIQNRSFAAPNASAGSNASSEVSADALDLNGFLKINQELAYIDSTGVLLPEFYDVYEIKSEIEFVLKSAPVFDKWFTMPFMSLKHGHIENRNYQYFAYYLESDEEADALTVTRVCSWPTYSFEMEGGKKFNVIQWQLMQTKYYFDEAGREVVECNVLTLVTDLKNRNGSWESLNILNEINYIPVMIQYMKNVKNTSLTKYYVRLAERYMTQPYWPCFDLRELNPYGSTYDLVQLDYADENDITLVRLTGELPIENIRNKPQSTAVSYYNKSDENVRLYASVHDYYDAEKSTTVEDYPMPGGRDSDSQKVDLVKLFSDAWPLVTDFYTDTNMPDRRFGRMRYTGVVSSDNITRSVEHYSAGAGGKDELMKSVCGAVNGMAGELGAVEELNAINEIDGFLSELRKAVVINFDIGKWIEIGKKSVNAPVAKDVRGEFYGQDLPIYDLFTNSISYHEAERLLYLGVSANIVSDDILNNLEKYSIRAALRSETGNYTMVSKVVSRVELLNPEAYSLGFALEVDLYNLDLTESGDHWLIYVLTKEVDGEEVVVFDTRAKVNIIDYDIFLKLEQPVGYKIACEARKLKVIVS